MSGSSLNILYLPEVALEKIFSFLSYDEIAKNRIVCKKFNEVSSKLLSRGFIQLEKRHTNIYKKVKSLLPRRESERRMHPLARHCDILQAIETRISMLNMTYVKYIESNLVCFIPGKVLDELKYTLNMVDGDETPPRTHQLLQELRDLSSMAMEHFDEHVLPGIKDHIDRKSSLSVGVPPLMSLKAPPKLFYGPCTLSNELYKMKKQGRSHKHCISYLSQSAQKLCQKVRKQNLRIKAQTVRIKEQERKIKDQNTKIQEQETSLAEIKKHIEEWGQKYMDLTNELVRTRDDMLAATAAATGTQRPSTSPIATGSPSTAKLFISNIKPRMTHILPKNYIHLQIDLDRRRDFQNDLDRKRNVQIDLDGKRSLQVDVDRKRKSNLLPEIPLKRKTPETDDTRKENEHNLNLSELVGWDRAKQENDSLESVESPFSRSSIESLRTSSLFRNAIFGRKRKMQEDIDLK